MSSELEKGLKVLRSWIEKSGAYEGAADLIQEAIQCISALEYHVQRTDDQLHHCQEARRRLERKLGVMEGRIAAAGLAPPQPSKSSNVDSNGT